METQEWDKAIADAQLFNKLYPNKIGGLYLLARANDSAGNAEVAVNYFTQLIALQPNIPDYYNNRGAIFFNKMQRYEDAKKDFEVTIQLDPRNGGFHLNLSRCYYMLGDIPRAREYAQKAKGLGASIDATYGNAIGFQ